jgi:hypothetical protein
MAGLVFFWSLAAFVVFVAALFFRPAAGDVLSPRRRRAFAAVLGTATTGLAVLAGTMPEHEVHRGAVILAAVAGAMFAWLVDAQLARPQPHPRAERFHAPTRVALLALGVAMPFVVLVASRAQASPVVDSPAPLPGREPEIIGPSLGEAVMYVRGNECGASWSDRNVSARLLCPPYHDPALDREWVITTELRDGAEPPLYLVRTCVVGAAPRASSPCTFTVQATPPGAMSFDLTPGSGVPVSASATLRASFDAAHRRWAIGTLVHGNGEEAGPATLVDARTLGIAVAPDFEGTPHLPFPPAPWALLLAAWAVGSAWALRAHRAARRQQAQLATARPAELRDGLLHVDGEIAPRQLVAGPRDRVQHHRGPAVWNPRTSAQTSELALVEYRRSRLALAADVAPGELEEHRARAAAAVNRAVAVFAALAGTGALPILVAAIGQLSGPGWPVHFQPQAEKQLVDAMQDSAL